MATVHFARDRLRARALKLLGEYQAMLILLASMNAPTKRRIDRDRALIAGADKRALQRIIEQLDRHVDRMRADAGATKPKGFYADFVQRMDIRPGLVPFVPAYFACSLFGQYPHVAAAVEAKRLPPHAHIELDPEGRFEPQDHLQLHLLEAALFEDVCIAWNDSVLLLPTAERPQATKIDRKRLSALHRAAVSSAFYMVEAYCNGLGFEVYLTCQDRLTEKEKEMVTEWDIPRNRPRFLALRDKLLHYPRLLVGAQAPLLQENNCLPLAFFLDSAKRLRDAIAHAGPGLNPGNHLPEKSQTLMGLGHDESARVVDSAIEVIESVATAVGRREGLFWLQHRQENGLFHPSALE